VLSGMDTVYAIEKQGTGSGTPKTTITVTRCSEA
jgi:hypothetical protein